MKIINQIKLKIGRVCTRPKHATVYFEGSLSNISLPNEKENIHIQKLNLKNHIDQKKWLNIYTDAFNRNWGKSEIDQYMIEHEYYNILHTFLFSDENGPVGIVSVGNYIKNSDIGLAHNLAVVSDRQSEGWGMFILLSAYDWLRNHGYNIINQERPLDRTESHNLSFEVGLDIKDSPDHWNIPPNGTKIARIIANNKLEEIKESRKYS